MSHVVHNLFAISLLSFSLGANAITPLSDEELSDNTGAGIGLVLENYELRVDQSSSWKVGIEGSAGELVFQDFWWVPNDGGIAAPTGGSGCSAGTEARAIAANTGGTGSTTRCVASRVSLPRTNGDATLGRVSDPIRFDVINKSTNTNSPGDVVSATRDSAGNAASRTVMSVAAANQTLATDRMDASYLMTLDHCSVTGSCPSLESANVGGTTRNVRYDVTRVTTRGMDIDGSNISLWAENNRLYYTGQINFRADEVTFVLNEDPSKPTTVTTPSWGAVNVYEQTPRTAYGNFRIGACLNDAYCDNVTQMTQFRRGSRGANTGGGAATTGGGVEFYYPIGRSFYQPIAIGTEVDGNLTVELKLLPNVYNVYKDFYEDKTVGDNLGYTTPRGYVRFGSITTNWDGAATVPAFTGCSGSGTINCGTLNQWNRYSYGCGFLNLSTCYGYNPVGPRRDFGYSRIEGIQIQYLKITTKGL